MASAPYVLARTFTESHAFAREVLGLSHGQYRVVTSTSTIRSIRGADLYLAPGWERRFDGHSMKAALRWTRMNVITPEDLLAAEEPQETPDGLEPAGTQPSIVEGADPALVADFEAFLNGGDHPHEEPTEEDTSNGDAMVSEGGPAEESEQPAAEDKRRRRRCKECGLLMDPDDVEAHAAEQLPVED